MSRTHHPNSNLISHTLYNYITLIQSNTIASIQRIVMKRERENEEIESLNLANFLILYSQARESKPQKSLASDKVFQCKTCNREFSSFQALGGHRASHKKPKLDGDELKSEAKFLSLGNKPKMHECSICGLKFSLGQALGGHMRKHRDAWNQGFSSINEVVAKVPVLKICLDLNLTPLENDLKLLFDKMTPKVHLSLL